MSRLYGKLAPPPQAVIDYVGSNPKLAHLANERWQWVKTPAVEGEMPDDAYFYVPAYYTENFFRAWGDPPNKSAGDMIRLDRIPGIEPPLFVGEFRPLEAGFWASSTNSYINLTLDSEEYDTPHHQ